MRNEDHFTSHYNESQFASWSAFLAGSVVGGALALLFAPQTGSDLRGVLRTYAAKTKDEVVERGREDWDTATEGGEEAVKDAGGEVAAQFKESGHEATKKGQPV